MTLLPNKSNFDYKSADLLMLVRKGGSFDQVLSFLNAHGGIDVTDEYQRTALMNLCITSVTPQQKLADCIAEELIRYGANINHIDKGGFSALYFAVQNNNRKLVDLLLQQPNIEKNRLPNLLFIALNRSKEFVIPLLKAGVDPFAGNEMTPYKFICDCQSGKILNGDMTEALEVLKELYPEKVQTIEPYFLNTIHYDYLEADFYTVFRKKKLPEILEFLNAHGGINSVSERGRTALIECMVAYGEIARMGYKKVVNPFAKDLIALGADINATDRYGYTALYFARAKKNEEMINFLLAQPDIVDSRSVSN